jgi:hypothetical protein
MNLPIVDDIFASYSDVTTPPDTGGGWEYFSLGTRIMLPPTSIARNSVPLASET